jgi:hypothetical protein
LACPEKPGYLTLTPKVRNGDNLLIGGLGDDVIKGGTGSDVIFGSAMVLDTGSFSNRSGSGDPYTDPVDDIWGQGYGWEVDSVGGHVVFRGVDTPFGQLGQADGNDALYAGDGFDMVFGGYGDDYLDGGSISRTSSHKRDIAGSLLVA